MLRTRWAAFISIAALALGGCSSGEPENSASIARVRLLSAEQFSATIKDIFGQDISEQVPVSFPPFTRTSGLLSSGASSIGMTSDQIQQLQQSAVSIAAKVVDEEHRDFLVPCKPAAADAADTACATQFFTEVGRLLYRRSIEGAELPRLVEEAGLAADELKDFYAGLASVLEGVLISPEVLFITDIAEPDPDNKGQYRLDAYSLASRLSFFLWNAAPDDELLRAAESGELHTTKGRQRSVDRMLASTRLADGVRAFFDDMMGFDNFNSLAKDAIVYPMVTGATLADAREQTLLTVVDHLVAKKRDYRDLFTTRSTFMSMNLAVVYDIPTVGDGWVPYEFPAESQRDGLLTHVSFLASHAHSVRSSPTLRGKALRELFLCQIVPPPPPDVDFSLLEDAGDVPTARERLDIHASNPSCAGCHLITDPMGLALENFDGAGRYRDTENGAEIDTTGNLDGASYTDVIGLSKALRDHPALPSCLVRRVYSYATGGPVSISNDRDVLEYFNDRFEKHDYKVPDLLREIALSDAFLKVRYEAPKAATTTTASGPTQDGESSESIARVNHAPQGH